MEGEDAELVAGLRLRQRAAFDATYARYGDRLYRFLLRMAGSKEVAEDLYQDAWIAIARGAGDLAADTDLSAWLFTVARNRYRSHRRWSLVDVRRLAQVAFEPRRPVETPEGIASARATLASLDRALGELSPEHREVLLLVGVEGLDQRQVAAVLGLSHDTLRKRLSRSRVELAGKLRANDVARASDAEGSGDLA